MFSESSILSRVYFVSIPALKWYVCFLILETRDLNYKNCNLFPQMGSGEYGYREVELLGFMGAHKLKDPIH